jgi:hypothetical protein
MPSSLVDEVQCFERNFCLQLQDKIWRWYKYISTQRSLVILKILNFHLYILFRKRIIVWLINWWTEWLIGDSWIHYRVHKSANRPYAEELASRPHPHTLFKINFSIFLTFTYCFPKCHIYTSGIPTKNVYKFLISHTVVHVPPVSFTMLVNTAKCFKDDTPHQSISSFFLKS